MDRRTFVKGVATLSVGTTGLVSGCLAHPPEKVCLLAEGTTAQAAATEVAVPLEDVAGEATVVLAAIPGAAEHTTGFPDVRGETPRVAAEAVEDGEARSLGYRVLDDPTFVETAGGFHRIDRARTDAVETERWLLVATPVEAPEVDGEAVPLGELDASARPYVEAAIAGARRFGSIIEEDDDDRRAGLMGRADLENPPKLASVTEQLRPDHPYFTHVFREPDPAPGDVHLAPEPEPTLVEAPRDAGAEHYTLEAISAVVTEIAFTYTGTPVADDPASFMVEYAESLDDPPLPAEQRAVFEAAIGDGYDPEAADDDTGATRDLHDRIGTPYVWFEGELYRVQFEGAFVGQACFD